MCIVSLTYIFNSYIADSALNRVRQRLQFLRPPPPRMTTPAHLQQSSSSSEQQPVTANVDTSTSSHHSFEDTSDNITDSEVSGKQSQSVEENENVSIDCLCFCLYSNYKLLFFY